MHDPIHPMTLRDKIGQMVWCGFTADGSSSPLHPTPNIRHLIEEGRIGGVILFSRNIQTPDQVAQLTRDLQQIAQDAGHPTPLCIAVDQEGGDVSRLQNGVTVLPGNMALGATRSEQAVRQAAAITAKELRALGITLNLAPAVDVNINPQNPVIGTRSYGESPGLVAKLGAAAVRGYQEQGISATAKHFPGHGDTSLDSHLTLPVVDQPLERIERVELLPFIAAIRAGVRAIMTTHIVFPVFDREHPATLSRNILTDLLRDRLDFKGVVLTDCMEMKAISDHYGPGRSAVLAVQAGADVVLVSHTFERQKTALDALQRAFQKGEIQEAHLDASVRRILALKRATSPAPVHLSRLPEVVGTPEHRHIAQDIARAAVTLVRDRAKYLPLRLAPSDRLLAVVPTTVRSTDAEEEASSEGLTATLRHRHGQVDTIPVDLNPSPEDIRRARCRAEEVDLIVAATRNAHLHSGQADLIHALADLDKPLIVIGLGAPYELSAFPEVQTYIAAYGTQASLLEATVEVLWGGIEPTGKLPVTVV